MYPITIGGETPVYLCEWNGGETVEIHTRETLTDTFGETLFDPDEDGWGWEIRELMTFDKLIEHLETYPGDKGRPFHNENMTITRIR